jgi:hypothetical protein
VGYWNPSYLTFSFQLIDGAFSATRPDPASSETIGSTGDIAMSAIELSLAALKEASSFAGKIPYISPVAGLLLQALTMRDASGLISFPRDLLSYSYLQQEVKQYEGEWEFVMDKVENAAGLVCNIGASCKKYNLEEKDLPASLRECFQSLTTYVVYHPRIIASSSYFSELDEIRDALEQRKKIGGIRKILLRKDLYGKVKQCNDKLSSVLQSFQVCRRWFSIRCHLTDLSPSLQTALAIDTRFAQLAEGLKVRVYRIQSP